MEEKTKPTLMIGIGGIGVKAVDVFKKKIQEEMQNNKEKSEKE